MCAQLPGLHMPYPTLPLLGRGRVSEAVVLLFAVPLGLSMRGYLVDAQPPLGLAPVVSAAFFEFCCHFPSKFPDLPHMLHCYQM